MAKARVCKVFVLLEPVHARRHLGVAAVHVLVRARAVESKRLVPREERAVRAAARRAHRDEVDSLVARIACHLPRDVEELPAVRPNLDDAPHRNHRLASDAHILRIIEAAVEPDSCNLAHLLLGCAPLSVGTPHQRPSQQAAVARLGEHPWPVVAAFDPILPVPIHEHEGDAVLDEVLDLPVHDLGLHLVVPAQHRLAVRRARPDAVPMVGIPAGEYECTYLVPARLHRPGHRHVFRPGQSERRLDIRRHGHAARRHAVRRDGESERMPPHAGVGERHAEPPLVGKLSGRVVVAHAVPALARADLAGRREVGRIQHAAT